MKYTGICRRAFAIIVNLRAQEKSVSETLNTHKAKVFNYYRHICKGAGGLRGIFRHLRPPPPPPAPAPEHSDPTQKLAVHTDYCQINVSHTDRYPFIDASPTRNLVIPCIILAMLEEFAFLLIF